MYILIPQRAIIEYIIEEHMFLRISVRFMFDMTEIISTEFV
jgi:hypothetical protein